MSIHWSNSDWRKRLTQDLEPLLLSAGLAAEISRYQGVPFALFAYPPTAEIELRREVGLLRTRVETQTGKKVTVVSMAELVQEAVSALPGGLSGLAAAERSHSYAATRERLQMLSNQMEATLSELRPIPEAVRDRVAHLDQIGRAHV